MNISVTHAHQLSASLSRATALATRARVHCRGDRVHRRAIGGDRRRDVLAGVECSAEGEVATMLVLICLIPTA